LSRLENWKRLKRRGLSGVLIAVSRLECGGWRFGDRSSRKIVKYLRLEKWKRLKTQRLFGFLIPDLRLGLEGESVGGLELSDEADPSTPVGRSGCRCWTHRHLRLEGESVGGVELSDETDPSTPVGRSGCRCWTHRHLRLETVLDGGGTRSGALLRVPVALSYKVTTHVNTVVTTWQGIKYPIFRVSKTLSLGGNALILPP